MIKPCEVAFANDVLEEEFNKISESDELKQGILKAIKNIEQNAFCGIQLPKYLMPEDYVNMYKITNLWKYNLPEGWRLLYSITTPNKAEILSIILIGLVIKDTKENLNTETYIHNHDKSEREEKAQNIGSWRHSWRYWNGKEAGRAGKTGES